MTRSGEVDELETMIETALGGLVPDAQRRSFVYGTGRSDGELVTWEMIAEADEAIRQRMLAI